jgi:CRP-like cAMP-binding protein
MSTATLTSLDNHPLLNKLSPQNQDLLASTGDPFVAESEVLAREGDPATGLYLIQSGFVELSTCDKHGRRTVVQTVGPDEILDWSGLLPPYLWQFEARTTGIVRGVRYDAQSLRDHCEEDHDFGYEVLKYMSGVLADRLGATRRTAAGWL